VSGVEEGVPDFFMAEQHPRRFADVAHFHHSFAGGEQPRQPRLEVRNVLEPKIDVVILVTCRLVDHGGHVGTPRERSTASLWAADRSGQRLSKARATDESENTATTLWRLAAPHGAGKARAPSIRRHSCVHARNPPRISPKSTGDAEVEDRTHASYVTAARTPPVRRRERPARREDAASASH